MSNTMKNKTIARIRELQVSAIIRTADQTLARDAMRAAVQGGFRAVEFTLTTPGAFELIHEFAGDTELLIGAGTVMTIDDVTNAVNAGARFLVSPICDPEIISAANERNAVTIPGTYTPTEMVTAHRAGADFVKLFPAHANTADFVRSVLGPLPFLHIFPTAGITVENFVDVLRAGAVGVGFVRPLFDPVLMRDRDFSAIEARAKDIHDRLKHAGDANA